jgi:CubicO group peptidase (beta-lactamase class C family)
VTAKTLGTFIAEEMAGPTEADFYLGVPDSLFDRIAPLVKPVGYEPPSPTPPPTDEATRNSVRFKTALGGFSFPREGVPGPAELANTPEWRRAEIGASNGHCNARGLGRILSALTAGGTSRGIRLVSPETIDLIFNEQFIGTDLYLDRSIRWGIGYALSGLEDPSSHPPRLDYIQPSPRLCYWGGWGGSFAAMDVERGITITYSMNQLHLAASPSVMARSVGAHDISAAYSNAIYECARSVAAI